MSAKSSKGHGRTPWLDEKSETPLIDDYVQRLGSFLEAMADGRIEASELKTQEDRVVALMKTVEPELSDEVHEKVTHLLVRAVGVQHHAYDPSARGKAAQDQVSGLINSRIPDQCLLECDAQIRVR